MCLIHVFHGYTQTHTHTHNILLTFSIDFMVILGDMPKMFTGNAVTSENHWRITSLPLTIHPGVCYVIFSLYVTWYSLLTPIYSDILCYHYTIFLVIPSVSCLLRNLQWLLYVGEADIPYRHTEATSWCLNVPVNWVVNDSGNGLSLVWCQLITCTNGDLLSTGP